MLKDFWNKLGLQLKLQILIQGFMVVILVGAQLWISMQFEHLLLSAAQERAIAVADSAVNSLNTLMIVKAGDHEVISDRKSRKLFIQKFGTSEKIREMRIIRAPSIDEEFEKGLPEEYPVDEMDQSVGRNKRSALRRMVLLQKA